MQNRVVSIKEMLSKQLIKSRRVEEELVGKHDVFGLFVLLDICGFKKVNIVEVHVFVDRSAFADLIAEVFIQSVIFRGNSLGENDEHDVLGAGFEFSFVDWRFVLCFNFLF